MPVKLYPPGQKGRHAVSGEEITVPGTPISARAQMRMANSEEYFTAGRERDKAIAVFKLRYREDVTSEWTLVDAYGREWDILGPPRIIPRKKSIELNCEMRA